LWIAALAATITGTKIMDMGFIGNCIINIRSGEVEKCAKAREKQILRFAQNDNA
jgi:hypothetical protein